MILEATYGFYILQCITRCRKPDSISMVVVMDCLSVVQFLYFVFDGDALKHIRWTYPPT